jgi:hypothetical protein
LATFSATDYMIIINAVTMSPMATSASLPITAAEFDTTAFGATYRSKIGGLKEAKLDIEWNEDFAAGQPDALLFPLLGTVVTFELRPTSGARSATNPAYTGSVLITQYTPLDSKVGDLSNFKTSWPTSGTILRQTS